MLSIRVTNGLIEDKNTGGAVQLMNEGITDPIEETTVAGHVEAPRGEGEDPCPCHEPHPHAYVSLVPSRAARAEATSSTTTTIWRRLVMSDP